MLQLRTAGVQEGCKCSVTFAEELRKVGSHLAGRLPCPHNKVQVEPLKGHDPPASRTTLPDGRIVDDGLMRPLWVTRLTAARPASCAGLPRCLHGPGKAATL